jgi:hypothetical protein
MRISISAVCVLALVGLTLSILLLVHDTSSRILIGPSDWDNDGNFFPWPAPLHREELPEDIAAKLSLWISWNPATKKGTIGSIRSHPFAPPRYFAIPYLGHAGDVSGTRIVVRCIETAAEYHVAKTPTNAQWATVYLSLPSEFCPGPVKIVATAGAPEFSIGVGSPFSVSLVTYLCHTTFILKAIVVILAWAMMATIVACGAAITRHFSFVLPTSDLAAGFVLLGIIGMVTFIVFHASPQWGRCITAIVFIGAVIALFRLKSVRQVLTEHHLPLIAWLIVAVGYAAFVSSVDNGAGSWNINGMFTPAPWSSDNQLPMLFAEALYDGTPRDQIVWGNWLASDRPPLLAALLLLPRTLILPPFAGMSDSTFLATGYMLCAIVIQAGWVVVVVHTCGVLLPKATGFVTALLVFNPFLMFNTVYAWPKILGATFVLLAFLLLSRMSKRAESSIVDLTLATTCGCLACLSHASNAFALFPIVAIFSRTIIRRGWREMAVATAAAALIAAPWLWWQATVQPGGNALVRYALAGDFGFDNRKLSVWTSVQAAYLQLGVEQWLRLKLDYFPVLVDVAGRQWHLGFLPGGARWWSENARILDLYIPLRAVSFPSFGLFLIPFLRIRNQLLKLVRLAALSGVSSIMIVWLCTFVFPITLFQAYGSLLLLILAGALVLGNWPVIVRACILTITILYAVVVWIILPIANGLRIDATSLVAMLICIGLGCFVGELSKKTQYSDENRHNNAKSAV